MILTVNYSALKEWTFSSLETSSSSVSLPPIFFTSQLNAYVKKRLNCTHYQRSASLDHHFMLAHIVAKVMLIVEALYGVKVSGTFECVAAGCRLVGTYKLCFLTRRQKIRSRPGHSTHSSRINCDKQCNSSRLLEKSNTERHSKHQFSKINRALFRRRLTCFFFNKYLQTWTFWNLFFWSARSSVDPRSN